MAQLTGKFNQQEVDQIKRLLKTTDHSVEHIKEGVGYSDMAIATFTKRFKVVVGQTPTDYRTEHRQSEQGVTERVSRFDKREEEVAQLLLATQLSFDEICHYLDVTEDDRDALQDKAVALLGVSFDDFRQKMWGSLQSKPPIINNAKHMAVYADVMLELGRAGSYDHILTRHGITMTSIAFSNELKKESKWPINLLRGTFCYSYEAVRRVMNKSEPQYTPK